MEGKNAEIKNMADILLKGGKMLNRGCPECNAPLFKFQGRTFCGKCGWEEESAPSPETAKAEPPQAKAPARPSSGGPRAGVDLGSEALDATVANLKRVVLQRISEYSKRLADQADTASISSNTGVLLDLMELLEKIMVVESKSA